MDDKILQRAVDEAVERAVSKQPSFGNDEARSIAQGTLDFGTILRWSEATPPPYQADTRELDKWLVGFVRKEPHLSGVVGQVTSIIRNRGFTISGGKIQVNRTKRLFHDADRKDGAPRGKGYRHFIARMGRNYYVTNMGAIAELGRDEPPRLSNGVVSAGPLRAMWSTDSTRFKMRTREHKEWPIREYPLAYYPPGRNKQFWTHTDFLRVVDNPTIEEDMADAGFSAVAMVRDVAEILVAVYQYDKEKLGSRAPNGLLLLHNVDEDVWETAMKGREAKLDGLERDRFGGVGVLTHVGPDPISAQLLALSQLPDNFERQTVIDMMMYLYALAFKYPPEEFWPVKGGSFGRGEEARLGIERASRKGDMDFFSSFQEQFQLELPSSIFLEYEQRDDRGRLVQAEIEEVYSVVAQNLYEAGLQAGEPLLAPTAEQARQRVLSYLAERQVIPAEWSDIEEEAIATDTEQARLRRLRERLMDESTQIRRAVRRYPEQPIVRYHWPSERTTVIWARGADATARKVWPVTAVQRALLYQSPDGRVKITDADVDAAIAAAGDRLGDEFAQILEAPSIDEVEEEE